jgi:hypothetical protein
MQGEGVYTDTRTITIGIKKVLRPKYHQKLQDAIEDIVNRMTQVRVEGSRAVYGFVLRQLEVGHDYNMK